MEHTLTTGGAWMISGGKNSLWREPPLLSRISAWGWQLASTLQKRGVHCGTLLGCCAPSQGSVAGVINRRSKSCSVRGSPSSSKALLIPERCASPVASSSCSMYGTRKVGLQRSLWRLAGRMQCSGPWAHVGLQIGQTGHCACSIRATTKLRTSRNWRTLDGCVCEKSEHKTCTVQALGTKSTLLLWLRLLASESKLVPSWATNPIQSGASMMIPSPGRNSGSILNRFARTRN
mmetsp:Transcript_92925/g.184473  ORF Transcript_92925/g.184473 Transcript_92925/m.184473 type:complete len:233 (-) Transcript_92925:1510-2208(-)